MDIVLVSVGYAKIINNEGECDVACFVSEKSECIFCFFVTEFFQMVDEIVMSYLPRFAKPIPRALDAGIDVSIGCLLIEVVVIDDFLWDE